MVFEKNDAFRFDVAGHPAGTFRVVEFHGHEGLSSLFEFEIVCSSARPDLDLDALVGKPATLTFQFADGAFPTGMLDLSSHAFSLDGTSYPIQGMVSVADVLNQFDQRAFFYRFTLVPPLWNLTTSHTSRVFLDKTVPEIVAEVLDANDLTGIDYTLDLTRDYPRYEFVCQYNENDFAFLSRWLEHEGIYYFFEHTEEGVRTIFADHRMQHIDIPLRRTEYLPHSALYTDELRHSTVHGFTGQRRRLTASVRVKDYNYMKPSLNVQATLPLPAPSTGEQYAYADHVLLPEQADALASVRREELLAREEVYAGEGAVPFFRAGYRFNMNRHFRDDYNRAYLLTEVYHEGRQPTVAAAETDADIRDGLLYQNRFSAIAADIQFRPLRLTPKPRIHGTISALVDASADTGYAELDAHGRYKVILPFDLSGRRDAKASHYIRMAQPYGGDTYGFHYPLHKGTEVLLTFMDGDPDRPVIAAIAPNATHPSLLTHATQTRAGFRTGGGSLLGIEDLEGQRHIALHAGDDKSSLVCGSTPDARIDMHSDAIGTIAAGAGTFLARGSAHIHGVASTTLAAGPFLQEAMQQSLEKNLEYATDSFSPTQPGGPMPFAATSLPIVAKTFSSQRSSALAARVQTISRLYKGRDMIRLQLQGAKPGIHLLRDSDNQASILACNQDGDDIVLGAESGHIAMHAGDDIQAVAGGSTYIGAEERLKLATPNGHLMFHDDKGANQCEWHNNAAITVKNATQAPIRIQSVGNLLGLGRNVGVKGQLAVQVQAGKQMKINAPFIQIG